MAEIESPGDWSEGIYIRQVRAAPASLHLMLQALPTLTNPYQPPPGLTKPLPTRTIPYKPLPILPTLTHPYQPLPTLTLHMHNVMDDMIDQTILSN